MSGLGWRGEREISIAVPSMFNRSGGWPGSGGDDFEIT